MSEFKDKVVIVTGGSSGIGEATAIEFVKRQANVVICGRDEEKGKKALRKIRKEGENVIFLKIDISDERDVERLVKETVNRFGKLDIAVNNAGISSPPSLIHEFDKKIWDKVISINLTGAWLCMKYELKEMVKSSVGVIVNISSILGVVASHMGISAYQASKFGITGLSKAAALEYADKGIRVNALCPGYIETPMVSKMKPENIQYLKSLQPLGRMGTVREVAQGVVWLASDNSTFVTGSSIIMDGGYTSR